MSQTQANAKQPGAYSTVVKLDKAVIDPGDLLHANFFVSGYGQITQAKLLLIAPDGIVRGNVYSGFSYSNSLEQGKVKTEISGQFVAELTTTARTQAKNGDPIEFTAFSDIPDSAPTIFSEARMPNSMLSVEYRIPLDFAPGTYKLMSVFTFFNGKHWVSDPIETTYVVRSVFQRHEAAVAGIACAAAVATIIAALYAAVGTFFTVVTYFGAK